MQLRMTWHVLDTSLRDEGQTGEEFWGLISSLGFSGQDLYFSESYTDLCCMTKLSLGGLESKIVTRFQLRYKEGLGKGNTKR